MLKSPNPFSSIGEMVDHTMQSFLIVHFDKTNGVRTDCTILNVPHEIYGSLSKHFSLRLHVTEIQILMI